MHMKVAGTQEGLEEGYLEEAKWKTERGKNDIILFQLKVLKKFKSQRK